MRCFSLDFSFCLYIGCFIFIICKSSNKCFNFAEIINYFINNEVKLVKFFRNLKCKYETKDIDTLRLM